MCIMTCRKIGKVSLVSLRGCGVYELFSRVTASRVEQRGSMFKHILPSFLALRTLSPDSSDQAGSPNAQGRQICNDHFLK